MRRRSVLAATSLIAAMVQPALAQSWPTHPVKVVVPAPAGSSLDIIARLLAEKTATA